ncbi:MAG: hypothetical protein ACHP9Z_10450 [Streptosporangiales bacterium]
MTAIATSYESLLKVRKGAVDIVDVPEFGFVAVTGTGEPGGAEFTEAVQALYSVSYGAHFRLKKLTGQAPRVMPLEGLWWVDDPAQQDIVAAVARGEVTTAGSDRGSWRWQALIMQPDPVDAELIAAAAAEAASKKDLPGLARLECIRWAEGRCAQLLHIGLRRRGAVDRGTAPGHCGSRLPPPRPPPRDLPRRPAPQRTGEAADDHPASVEPA